MKKKLLSSLLRVSGVFMVRLMTLLKGLIWRGASWAGVPGHAQFKEGLPACGHSRIDGFCVPGLLPVTSCSWSF